MTSRWNTKICNAYVYKYTPKNTNSPETPKIDVFMKEQTEKETGKQIGTIALHYLPNSHVIQGFIESLGDTGMRKIINAYTADYLSEINEDNALYYKDVIIDFVRNIKLFDDGIF